MNLEFFTYFFGTVMKCIIYVSLFYVKKGNAWEETPKTLVDKDYILLVTFDG